MTFNDSQYSRIMAAFEQHKLTFIDGRARIIALLAAGDTVTVRSGESNIWSMSWDGRNLIVQDSVVATIHQQVFQVSAPA
ncbi:hypothetical protein HNP46_004178 [Pseudomonas nitritireducens]|uniref:Uncharacterized protein n=1 Tax=Pseudomonas nitroreducens TaxID=46680 RepID=A0A7W7P3J2_PSENT|nr:hypothetical protein [Pseudomonas nitritireducens]MBB4865297.1 hypothetical protein [Pseudomonas nitritireducens]